MAFRKAVYGKGGHFGSIIKAEDLNDALQPLGGFEPSTNTSFLPAPAPHFSQSLVPSWHCLLVLFSFSPFPCTVNPQRRNNGLNPTAENNLTTQISSQPLGFCCGKLCRQHFRGDVRVWKGQVHFPVLPNTRSTLGCGAGLGTIPNHPTFHGLSGITQTPRNLSNETWQHTQPP